MGFKKSNIIFDEKPVKGSMNAITSGAVAENSGGIPIYKKKATFQIQNPTSGSNVNISPKITFANTTELHEFANKYVCIGICNIESFINSERTTPFSSGKYVSLGITHNRAEIASNITAPDLYYNGVALPKFSISSTTIYYNCDLVFVDVNDLTEL